MEQRLKIVHLLEHKASNWIRDKVSWLGMSVCVVQLLLTSSILLSTSLLFHSWLIILPYFQDGNTPLHLAALRADEESVSTLLKCGKRCLNTVNKVCG